MDNQKDYVNNFRREAEAIISQQLAELREQDGTTGASELRSQASPQQLRALEQELKDSLENIMQEANGQRNREELRNELMTYYNHYIDDISQRTENGGANGPS